MKEGMKKNGNRNRNWFRISSREKTRDGLSAIHSITLIKTNTKEYK